LKKSVKDDRNWFEVYRMFL